MTSVIGSQFSQTINMFNKTLPAEPNVNYSPGRITVTARDITITFEGSSQAADGAPNGYTSTYSEYVGSTRVAFIAGAPIPVEQVTNFIAKNSLSDFYRAALSGGNFLVISHGDDVVFTGSGNDIVNASGGNDVIYGDDGIDRVGFRGKLSEYDVSRSSAVTVVRDGADKRDGTDQLHGVERLTFSDVAVAYDDAAAQMYRLYRAAFDRVPEPQGLGFWVSEIDRGATLEIAANRFVGSTEFRSLYGDVDNATFVELVYRNVLDRAPDAAGAAYWKGQLDTGYSRAQLMLGFSESAENRTAVAGAIADGILFDNSWSII